MKTVFHPTVDGALLLKFVLLSLAEGAGSLRQETFAYSGKLPFWTWPVTQKQAIYVAQLRLQ
jgi:hypothetical protein